MAYAPGSTSRTRTTPRAPGTRDGRGSAKGKAAAGALPAPARRTSTTLIAGLAIGLAIGAGAALLFAPRSGAETRRALKNRGKRARNSAADTWEDLRLELAQLRRALKRKRRDAALEVVEETKES